MSPLGSAEGGTLLASSIAYSIEPSLTKGRLTLACATAAGAVVTSGGGIVAVAAVGAGAVIAVAAAGVATVAGIAGAAGVAAGVAAVAGVAAGAGLTTAGDLIGVPNMFTGPAPVMKIPG